MAPMGLPVLQALGSTTMIRWTTWGRLLTRGRRPGGRPTKPRRSPPPTDDGAADEPERPCGCGWFDSSLDLRQGLAVIEHRDIHFDLALELMLAEGSARR